jgi:hypothetical protein
MEEFIKLKSTRISSDKSKLPQHETDLKEPTTITRQRIGELIK